MDLGRLLGSKQDPICLHVAPLQKVSMSALRELRSAKEASKPTWLGRCPSIQEAKGKAANTLIDIFHTIGLNDDGRVQGQRAANEEKVTSAMSRENETGPARILAAHELRRWNARSNYQLHISELNSHVLALSSNSMRFRMKILLPPSPWYLMSSEAP